MSDVVKNIYRGLLRKLPDKPAVYLIYFRGYRKLLNLKKPTHFGEKIQWLKLYGHLDELSDYVDKYEVRKYVEQTVGTSDLNTLYGVYDTAEEVDFDSLPDRFVLKCTNGSGAVLICKDKSRLDKRAAIKEMKKWLADDFAKMKKEPQYKNVKNRIIAEEYLEDESGALRDYKFYCYDGIPYCYGVFSNRYTDETVDMYDMAGTKLDGVLNGGVKNSDYIIPQGEEFPELVEVVKRLAKPFQFVRVDFYIANGRVYFGELTFTDGAGSDPFTPESFDMEMAKRIKLGRVLLSDQ
jgi:uncharacterized protein YlbG (UPF0298 family)